MHHFRRLLVDTKQPVLLIVQGEEVTFGQDLQVPYKEIM